MEDFYSWDNKSYREEIVEVVENTLVKRDELNCKVFFVLEIK